MTTTEYGHDSGHHHAQAAKNVVRRAAREAQQGGAAVLLPHLPRALRAAWPPASALRFAELASRCVAQERDERPTATQVCERIVPWVYTTWPVGVR